MDEYTIIIYRDGKRYSFSFTEKVPTLYCKISALINDENTSYSILGRMWWAISEKFGETNLEIKIQKKQTSEFAGKNVRFIKKNQVLLECELHCVKIFHEYELELFLGKQRKKIVSKYPDETISEDLISFFRNNEKEKIDEERLDFPKKSIFTFIIAIIR